MKVIDYYAGIVREWSGNVYIYQRADDTSTALVRMYNGETVHLPVGYPETLTNGMWRVISPRSGWIKSANVYGITEVSHLETDVCTPPSSVTMDTLQRLLIISGGAGGDLNEMTGYGIEYRERLLNSSQYGPWAGAGTIASKGPASFVVEPGVGKARQYRVRTMGEAGSAYYSDFVVCPTEILPIETPEQKEKSDVVTLHVFDSALKYAGRIENWNSLTWDEEYQGKGAFTLTVPDTDKYAALIKRGCFLYRDDRTTCMLVVMVERNSEKHTINAGGYTALQMLEYRMVYNKFIISNIEEGIYRMVNANLRGLPMVCSGLRGLTPAVDEEAYDCPGMYQAVLSLIKTGDLGMRTVFDPQNRTITFEVYEGDDRTYGTEYANVFSSEFGNLYDLIVTEDDDLLKNVAVICSAAHPGVDKTTFTYEIAEGLTGLERRELLVDGDPRGTTGETDENGNEISRPFEEWKKAMLDKGRQALNDYNLVQSFQVSPNLDDYGKRYILGDRVTCRSARYGVQFDARITKARERFNQNGHSMVIILGKPTVNYIQKELLTHG